MSNPLPKLLLLWAAFMLMITMVLTVAPIGLAAGAFTELPYFKGFFKAGATVACTVSKIPIVGGLLGGVGDSACAAKELAKQQEQITKPFKQAGLVGPLKGALLCSTYPEYNIIRDEEGKPTNCLESSDDAHNTIPPWLVGIYQRAGAKHNVPWQLLAAINWNDTDFGALDQWRNEKTAKQNRVGWIPFTQAEWKRYRDDGGNAEPFNTESPYGKNFTCQDPGGELGAGPGGGSGGSGGGDASGGSVSGLPGPKAGAATYYDPSAGGINGRAGGGSFGVPIYGNTWAAARLGTVGYPKANHAWHGVLVRVTNLDNNKSIEVPIADIGPGGPPLNGKPRVIDLLPGPAKALGNGTTPGTLSNVRLQPLRKLSLAETKKLALKGSAVSAAVQANVKVSFEPDALLDTCDPVDAIFTLANFLSERGVQGGVWREALGSAGEEDNGGGADISGGSGEMIRPAEGPITGVFGEQRPGHKHGGLDIAAPSGSPIKAAASGEVSLVQSIAASGGFGNFMCIKHDAKIQTCYAHAIEPTYLKVGASVKQGQRIMKVGNTGHSFGAHLHFEVRVSGRAVDPMAYLKGDKKVIPVNTDAGGKKQDPGDSEAKPVSASVRSQLKKLNPGGRPVSFDSGFRPFKDPTPAECRQTDSNPARVKLIPAMQGAAELFDLNWTVIASIVQIESNFGCNKGRSSAAAYGWTQFIDSTWKTMGVDADGDGKADRQNPIDSVYATARYLAYSGAPKDYEKAIFAYNHADWYVRKVLAGAKAFGGGALQGGIINKLVNGGIADVVQTRDYPINRDVCVDETAYKDCIAHLYSKLTSEDPQANEQLASGDLEGALPGDCGSLGSSLRETRVETLPDYSIRPQEDKAMVSTKPIKGLWSSPQPLAELRGRKDAITATQAVIKAFRSCNPKFTDRQVQVWDWNSPGHLSHRNGGDNDFHIDGVTDLNRPGVTYDQTHAAQLGAFFLRAGAAWIFWDDQELQDWVESQRAREIRKHPEASKKYNFFARPMFTAPGVRHFDHFHIRWFTGSTTAPARIQVYLKDKGSSGNVVDAQREPVEKEPETEPREERGSKPSTRPRTPSRTQPRTPSRPRRSTPKRSPKPKATPKPRTRPRPTPPPRPRPRPRPRPEPEDPLGSGPEFEIG